MWQETTHNQRRMCLITDYHDVLYLVQLRPAYDCWGCRRAADCAGELLRRWHGDNSPHCCSEATSGCEAMDRRPVVAVKAWCPLLRVCLVFTVELLPKKRPVSRFHDCPGAHTHTVTRQPISATPALCTPLPNGLRFLRITPLLAACQIFADHTTVGGLREQKSHHTVAVGGL